MWHIHPHCYFCFWWRNLWVSFSTTHCKLLSIDCQFCILNVDLATCYMILLFLLKQMIHFAPVLFLPKFVGFISMFWRENLLWVAVAHKRLLWNQSLTIWDQGFSWTNLISFQIGVLMGQRGMGGFGGCSSGSGMQWFGISCLVWGLLLLHMLHPSQSTEALQHWGEFWSSLLFFSTSCIYLYVYSSEF
jgi:hypothetical protein